MFQNHQFPPLIGSFTLDSLFLPLASRTTSPPTGILSAELPPPPPRSFGLRCYNSIPVTHLHLIPSCIHCVPVTVDMPSVHDPLPRMCLAAIASDPRCRGSCGRNLPSNISSLLCSRTWKILLASFLSFLSFFFSSVSFLESTYCPKREGDTIRLGCFFLFLPF